MAPIYKPYMEKVELFGGFSTEELESRLDRFDYLEIARYKEKHNLPDDSKKEPGDFLRDHQYFLTQGEKQIKTAIWQVLTERHENYSRPYYKSGSDL